MADAPQAAREDLQLLLLLPLAPFTYHVVLAKAGGDNAKSSAKTSVLLMVSFRFITAPPLGVWRNLVPLDGQQGSKARAPKEHRLIRCALMHTVNLLD